MSPLDRIDEKSGPEREGSGDSAAVVGVHDDGPTTGPPPTTTATARRRPVSFPPSAGEGAEIVSKLDAALVEASVYGSISADSGLYRVTVQLGYRAARHLVEVLGGVDRG